MPDQDEFAPLAHQWRPVHLLFVDGENVEKVADDAFRTLKQMLRSCGGCLILPELVHELTCFAQQVGPRTDVGWRVLGNSEVEIVAKLDGRMRTIDNRRVDAVAVRSCRIAAVQIAAKTFPTSIGPAFASMLAQHLLCHFVLDRARAFGVGSLYTEETARAAQQRVLDILEEPLHTFGERWICDPAAQFQMPRRFVEQTGTEGIFADEERYQLD